jgi:outer membrane protein OmpA-like peptidoglycan-associated protein
MRSLLHATGLALLLCGGVARPATAADADLKITVTNGDDTQGDVRVQVRPAGQHDGDVVAWGGSGDDVKVPPGTYDVEITYNDGAASKIVWLDGFAISGRIEKTVDVGMPVATLHIVITNGGADVGDDGTFDVRPLGNHGGDVIASGRSGGTARLAAGTYDVDARYQEGAVQKTVWLDGLALSGKVDKTVEVGMPVATLHIVITNGGSDVGEHGTFEVRPAGNHGGDVIASGRSGGTARLAAGTYDVDARYQDGAVQKTVWLDGLALSGKVDKTVEVGVPVADVTWHITNHGADASRDAIFEIRPGGQHNGDVVASGNSGQQVRLPAGNYDIDIAYGKGMIHKTIWLDNQNLTGKVERTTDLGLNPAHAMVSATLNGSDVGDKAWIGITPAGQHDEIGAIRGGETAELDAGRYDLTATMPGAEGSLHDAAIEGQVRLIVAMKPLRTEELKSGGPPPEACTIEVYGVNFDFDKAVLRPDSEQVLRSVLRLFTATPSFSAEVGGHTDNIGQPNYNMKLSEARAQAVKAWLVAHGVTAARVTARGYGDTHPLVPNDTDAGRFKNRRVELRRVNCR